MATDLNARGMFKTPRKKMDRTFSIVGKYHNHSKLYKRYKWVDAVLSLTAGHIIRLLKPASVSSHQQL